jgi:hypothetical protein
MSGVGEPAWIEFRRADASAVVDMVRAVAEAKDPGEYGDGVEVVVEAPRKGWLGRLLDRDGLSEQARIVVTKPGGEVTYPFDIQLVTDRGGRAADDVPVRRGWARSNSDDRAYLIQKGQPGTPYSWGDLVGGAVAALCALREDAPDEGWRASVDRGIRRE